MGRKIVATIFCCFLFGCFAATVGCVGGKKTPEAVLPNPQQISVDVDGVLLRHTDAVRNGEMDLAFDYLSAAMRLFPESEKVFDQSIRFVEISINHSDDEAVFLGEIVLGRIEGLIPFQEIGKIANARRRFNQIMDEIDSLFGVEEVLEDTVSVGQSVDDGLSDLFTDPLERFQLWLGDKQLEEWLFLADDLIRQTIQLDMEPPRGESPATRLGQSIRDHILSGEDIFRRVFVFSDEMPGNESVRDCRRQIESRLTNLSRAGEWLYNVWAYQRMVQVKERQSTDASLDLLIRLAAIDEGRLTPWFFEIYIDLWKRLFDRLTTDEERVSATKARMLKQATVGVQ